MENQKALNIMNLLKEVAERTGLPELADPGQITKGLAFHFVPDLDVPFCRVDEETREEKVTPVPNYEAHGLLTGVCLEAEDLGNENFIRLAFSTNLTFAGQPVTMNYIYWHVIAGEEQKNNFWIFVVGGGAAAPGMVKI